MGAYVRSGGDTIEQIRNALDHLAGGEQSGPYGSVSTSVVTVTAASQTLAELLGAALSAKLSELTVRNQSGVAIYFNAGTATTSSTEIPSGGAVTLPLTKTAADTLEFIGAAASCAMAVIQMGGA